MSWHNSLHCPLQKMILMNFLPVLQDSFKKIRKEFLVTGKEFIALQSNLSFVLKICTFIMGSIWLFKPKQKYLVLVCVTLSVKVLFGTIYLCELPFSNMKVIKNKFRSRLIEEHLDNCIRIVVNNYTPDIL